MERVCFLARIRPERLDEYRERHKHVWPVMRAALRETGWGNYSLFLSDDRILVNKRWQADMAGFFVAEGSPDQSFQRLPEVFHLEEE